MSKSEHDFIGKSRSLAPPSRKLLILCGFVTLLAERGETIERFSPAEMV